MRTLVLESIVRAKTAISHNGGEKNGNMGLFRRETKWYKKDGKNKSFSCPVISANSLRSNLRKASSKIFLDELGEEGEPLKVELPLFNMLFSGGGQVSSKKENLSGDIGHFQDLRENVTPLSLWGTSKGNAMMPSKVDVYDMIPIAKETIEFLPKKLKEDFKYTLPSVNEYIELRFNTTKDLKNVSEFDKYLETIEDEAERQSIQMLYYTEMMNAGTPIYWKIVLRDITDIEYSLFMNALVRFEQLGRVGGKRSNGNGEIEFVKMEWTDITKVGNEITVQEKTKENIYKEFLQSNKSSTKAFLKMM